MSYRVLARLSAAFGLIVGAALCGCGKSTSTGDGGKGGGEVNVEDAKKKSIENLEKIGMALHDHASANGGDKFPSPGSPTGTKSQFEAPVGWRVSILRYINQQELYSQEDIDRRVPLTDAVRKAVIPEFQKPLAKEQSSKTNYRVFVGNGAAFEWNTPLRFGDFRDSLSNTILVVESAEPIEWSSLDDFEYDPKKPLPKLGIFPGGFHALMGDGAVIWIPDNTDEKTIRAMITRNGGETFRFDGKPLNPQK